MSNKSLRTPLYDEHVKLNGKMTDFAGWEMPLWYDAGHITEHNRVRAGVGIFDICHMGEFFIEGEEALDFFMKILTNNVDKLKNGQAQYNFMLNEKGGVIDDCIVYRRSEDKWMLVVNAGNIEGDFEHIKKNATPNLKIENKSDSMGKLDLQGKYAPKLLEKLAGRESVEKLGFYKFREGFKINDIDIIISRTGYTGEIGFEIYFDSSKAVELWNLFLEEGKEFDILPCGLASRDSLRLEAGLPLHGSEIHPDMIALGHPWSFCISDRDGYIGREALKNGKPEYYIKSFIVKGKRKAMPHYFVFTENGKQLGEVVSGVMSPSLNNQPVGYCKIKEDLPTETKLMFKRNADDPDKRGIIGLIRETPFVDTLTWRKKMKNFI
jgi:aminomethyltransferase